RRFWDDMRNRFEEFSVALHPDKTPLVECGRFAAERRAHRGLGKPETFNFLGFTFICERNSRGRFLVKRTTRRDCMRATLRRIKEELRRRMHEPIPEQGAWLKQVVSGFSAIDPRLPSSISRIGAGFDGTPPRTYSDTESCLWKELIMSYAVFKDGDRISPPF